ncbi:hypothetical protein EOE18_13685 [Novosphingobium umbonatum]|uniref:Uncharacterized protein n=1 Tax=Novosphingobium umbonatum TaxID=1908524 RepID=A0A3S2UPY4_9SPHN|nr:hypothetical protein [Novosphingobium umbonatum]RVU03906.1 hypothetical protein EOE18_13685 [Novosphingobium umbonatum]
MQQAVIDLHNTGIGKKAIMAELGVSTVFIDKSLYAASEGNSIRMKRDLMTGAEKLAAALRNTAGYQSAPARFTAPIGASRAMGLVRRPVAASDTRRFSDGRSPCPNCGTRGDIPCKHQRPR